MNIPNNMEEHFLPGFKTKPAVHVGSQTMRLYNRDPMEQAYEGLHLAAANDKDVVLVRNIDPEYLKYWNSLMGQTNVINITGVDQGEYLSRIILDSPDIISKIKKNMDLSSKLMVYLPTLLEQQLAEVLGIPLHGSPNVTDMYGTKSGIRALAKEAGISMPPGYVCRTYMDVKKAIHDLSEKFELIVIKHDLSSAGRWSKKLNTKKQYDLHECLDEISGGKFIEGKDIVVVEAWLKNRGALCAHIEIDKGMNPVVCAAWRQIMADDGITYIGAAPLSLSEKTMESFKVTLSSLAKTLKKNGAVGSFGPDFLIVPEDEGTSSEICELIELNARVPVTSFPLEIIKQIKGEIGTGFYVADIKLNKTSSFRDIREVLEREHLLITEKDVKAHGVVPYNIGLLPWGHLYIVVIASEWDEVVPIVEKIKTIFGNNIATASPQYLT